MNSVLKFIRTTITGGIIFLLPLTLVLIIAKKALDILMKLSTPFADIFPHSILGFDGHQLLTLALLLIICFMSGLLFRLSFAKSWIKKLEDNFICYLPGYTLMKSVAADALRHEVDVKMIPVMVQDGDAHMLGFLTEEEAGYCAVFIPGAPHHEEGEIKIFPSALVTKINIPVNTAVKQIKSLGKGMIRSIPERENM